MFEARRVRAPFLVAKIAMRRARRENEIIVADIAAVDCDRAPGCVDAGHGPPQHANSAVVTKQSADRKGDVAGREAGRCHLIEQGLEQVIVVAIDQRDVDRLILQAACAFQAAKPGADDDDMRTFAQPHRRALNQSQQPCVHGPASGAGEGEKQEQQ